MQPKGSGRLKFVRFENGDGASYGIVDADNTVAEISNSPIGARLRADWQHPRLVGCENPRTEPQSCEDAMFGA